MCLSDAVLRTLSLTMSVTGKTTGVGVSQSLMKRSQLLYFCDDKNAGFGVEP